MILDAPSPQIVLTPETALSVVEKEVKRKGWANFEITDVRLVYTPYWIFSFDATMQPGQASSAKTALNAYSGELNDFVSVLLERPLKKTNKTQEGVECEVEPTALNASEVKESARGKIAAELGLKPENVFASAFTKYYIPFYRVWVDVEKDTHKIDVDACLGAPLGAEGIPERKKGFGEKASETLRGIKSPKDLVEVGGKAVGELGKPGALSPSSPGPGGIPKIYFVLGAVIVIALVLILARSTGIGGGAGVSCALGDDYLGQPFMGIGARPIEPIARGKTLSVKGSCGFSNAGDKEVLMIVQVKLVDADSKEILASQSIDAQPPAKSEQPTVKQFELNWTDNGAQKFGFEFERMV